MQLLYLVHWPCDSNIVQFCTRKDKRNSNSGQGSFFIQYSTRLSDPKFDWKQISVSHLALYNICCFFNYHFFTAVHLVVQNCSFLTLTFFYPLFTSHSWHGTLDTISSHKIFFLNTSVLISLIQEIQLEILKRNVFLSHSYFFPFSVPLFKFWELKAVIATKS